MSIQLFTKTVKQNESLSYDDMIQAAELVFNEETPQEDIAAFLVALSEKGETTEEIAALATVMKANATSVPVPNGAYIDNCGTGGDGLKASTLVQQQHSFLLQIMFPLQNMATAKFQVLQAVQTCCKHWASIQTLLLMILLIC